MSTQLIDTNPIQASETLSESKLMLLVNRVFNVAVPDNVTVEAFSSDDTHPSIPIKDEQYVFKKEDLRDVLAFLMEPDGDGLYIMGPTGSGKTSLICQVAARLNWPTQNVTAHGRLELSDLIGHHTLVNGSMHFCYGPLATAVKFGHLLIINEMDLAEPAELAGLNDILEGSPLVITQNGGEVILPHPKFRFIATGNSEGSGDITGLYSGVMQQNLAYMDRFRLMSVNYASEAVELQILSLVTPSLPDEICQNLVRVANEIRRLFVGESNAHIRLTVTLSTRTLIRWAKLIVLFQGAPDVIEYALYRALTARAEPEQRTAIHQIVKDIFG